jgi:hypothetical protein
VPTKKQRRRQQKLRRHEWEDVWVDAEGHEIEVDAADGPPAGKAAKGASRNGNAPRGRRTAEPPSFRRAVKRSVLFAGFMFLVIWITAPNAAPLQRVGAALFYAILFIPIAYLADTVAHRIANRRRTGNA